ncbi:MAG: tetratricopeptide repeat protein [Pseudomonadota bacterium]
MSRDNRTIAVTPLLFLLVVAGCASSSAPPPPPAASTMDPIAQAMAQASAPATPEQMAAAERADPLTRAAFWNEEYRKDPSNLNSTISLLRALRGIDSYERIEDIARQAIAIHPTSWELYLEYGRAQLSQGKPEQAVPVLARSADFAPATEASPLAALGLAFDQLERHEQAQQAYSIALERQPDRVSTLSNYGLSLALSGDLENAEVVLTRATSMPGADVRVRQNLALILGLQGRFEEMKVVAPFMPERTAQANRMALESLMGVQRSEPTQEPVVEPVSEAFDPEPDAPKQTLTLRPRK